jgi:haloalkane dehalogenase
MRYLNLTPEAMVDQGNWSSTNAHQLFWIMFGENVDSMPVVYVHGIPTWSWLWRNVLQTTATYTRSIAVDLPGFGMSSQARCSSVGQMAESIEALIDQEIGTGAPVALALHDFGALVGAELISRAPKRFPKLVVTNTSYRAEAWLGGGPLRVLSVPGAGQIAMWLARPWMLSLAMYPFTSDPSARSGNAFAGYWYPFRRGFGQSLARLFQQRPVSSGDFDRWREALKAYPGATLILWGANDPAFTLVEMSDILGLSPAADSLVFEHANHFLPEERPFAVGRRIRAFLADVPV